jgi:hypothetical protein
MVSAAAGISTTSGSSQNWQRLACWVVIERAPQF